MKQLTRFLILLVGLLGFTGTAFAQCTPDSTLGNVTGLYPDSLARAALDQPYSQVINVVASEDTTIQDPILGTLNLDFCSIRIDSVTNLPAGMSFACNEPECTAVINHTDEDTTMRFCVELTGTPTSVFDDSIRVYAKLSVGFYNDATTTCTPLNSLPDSLTTIVFPIRFVVEDPTSIADISEEMIGLKVLPNPTTATSTVAYELPERANVAVGIYDLMGRQLKAVQQGMQAPGAYQYEVDFSDLPKGLYLLRLDLDGGKRAFSKKILHQ